MSEEKIQILKNNEAINALANEIVALIQAELPTAYNGWIAQDAVLLAQHRLFGGAYMKELFAGGELFSPYRQ